MSVGRTAEKSTLDQVMGWYRQQQAIAWANVDKVICRHMMSQGHTEFIDWPME